jgi:hypothetical protein
MLANFDGLFARCEREHVSSSGGEFLDLEGFSKMYVTNGQQRDRQPPVLHDWVIFKPQPVCLFA